MNELFSDRQEILKDLDCTLEEIVMKRCDLKKKESNE